MGRKRVNKLNYKKNTLIEKVDKSQCNYLNAGIVTNNVEKEDTVQRFIWNPSL